VIVQSQITEGEKTASILASYLRVWCDDVDKADDGQQNDTDEPEDELFPQRQRLHEAHLLAVPDARQMLLTVGMSDELQQQQQHNTRSDETDAAPVMTYDAVINNVRCEQLDYEWPTGNQRAAPSTVHHQLMQCRSSLYSPLIYDYVDTVFTIQLKQQKNSGVAKKPRDALYYLVSSLRIITHKV